MKTHSKKSNSINKMVLEDSDCKRIDELYKSLKKCPVCKTNSLIPTLGFRNIECMECSFTTDY